MDSKGTVKLQIHYKQVPRVLTKCRGIVKINEIAGEGYEGIKHAGRLRCSNEISVRDVLLKKVRMEMNREECV